MLYQTSILRKHSQATLVYCKQYRRQCRNQQKYRQWNENEYDNLQWKSRTISLAKRKLQKLSLLKRKPRWQCAMEIKILFIWYNCSRCLHLLVEQSMYLDWNNAQSCRHVSNPLNFGKEKSGSSTVLSWPQPGEISDDLVYFEVGIAVLTIWRSANKNQIKSKSFFIAK